MEENELIELSEDLQKALDNLKKAQKRLKKRQQLYCINKYYENKKKQNKML